MALPRKKAKIPVDIDPPRIGTEYLKYGAERIEELLQKTNKKTKYFPVNIGLEDLDLAAFEYVEKGEMKLVLDGKDVPVIWLDSERWGEFSQTWKYTDDDKNILMPLVTVRRSGKEKGTRIGEKWRIAQGKTFRYIDVPFFDDGVEINYRIKIPEPVNVDLIYDIRLFSKYTVDINEQDEQVFRTFASRQGYVEVKGNPMPILLEEITEENTVQNIDGDRYFVTAYKLRLQGMIQDESEFEVVKTTRPPKLRYGFI
ncbi:MAG: hypothetical protein HC836_35890 [Richelia sp. RM2_1_2]|nr:hypothetical protein [Richelia sp. RM2_1_2]